MRDEWFIRGSIPMTKSEVRAVSISKLELEPGAILYDIGAGTGSVSVEAAGQMPGGRVFAVERNEEGVRLIEKNCERFQVENVSVIRGSAPEALTGLPAPDCVFVGGSGGRMEQILRTVLEKNPSVRIVVNVIALESLSQVLDAAKKQNLEPEILSLHVAKGERTGNYHLMKGQNPVYVISMGGRDPWAGVG